MGIYFEANGHGTVLFAPSLVQRLHPLAETGSSAAAGLLALERLNNQACRHFKPKPSETHLLLARAESIKLNC